MPKEKANILSPEACLSKLAALRKSVDEALDNTWDRSDKGFESMGWLLDDLIDDEERRKGDWYTPCAVLYAWLQLTLMEPHTTAEEYVKPEELQPFINMLQDRVYDPRAVRRLGFELIHGENSDALDIPDEVWTPFERLYDDADPDADNHNMN